MSRPKPRWAKESYPGQNRYAFQCEGCGRGWPSNDSRARHQRACIGPLARMDLVLSMKRKQLDKVLGWLYDSIGDPHVDVAGVVLIKALEAERNRIDQEKAKEKERRNARRATARLDRERTRAARKKRRAARHAASVAAGGST